MQPLVLASVEWREIQAGRSAERVVLTNVGKGPAIFVHVDDFAVIPAPGGKITLHIPSADCILPEKEAVREVLMAIDEEGKVVYRDGGEKLNYTSVLKPGPPGKTHEITIHHEDIDGMNYWTKMQMGKDGNRLLGHGRG